MADRFLVWLSASMLTAGLCASTLGAAGTAGADGEPGTNATTSAQASVPAGSETDSVANVLDDGPNPDDMVTAPTVDGPDEANDEADDEESDYLDEESEHLDGDDEAEEGADEEIEAVAAAGTPAPTRRAAVATVVVPVVSAATGALPVVTDQDPADDTETKAVGEAGPTSAPESAAVPSEPAALAAGTPDPLVAQRSTETARVMVTAVEPQARAPLPSLLNVVGSFFWGLFDLATKLVDFPPTASPGSTVTAGRSRLEIDCGDGYTADADWYFPSDGEPDKFIYFQHGFPARAGFYNLTLERLAARNNAVVVAPSITSNIFACDACAASGEPMHAAVARLFEGDRAALLASAVAAGYGGPLPEQFVFTGQSAGASLAVAAAGFYYQFAPTAEKSDLAGVLLYEVSAIGGSAKGNALTNALRRLPADIAVLNIAAEPNTLNSQGSANAVFVQERLGQFNGLQLVGGAHSDAFRSDVLLGFPQVLVSLLFGFSSPQNVEAVHVLTTGWLTDMYAGRVYDQQTRTGIYGEPGKPGDVVVDIPTAKGLARGYVLPALTPAGSPFDALINWFFGLINVNLYARCAVDYDASADSRGDFACAN